MTPHQDRDHPERISPVVLDAYGVKFSGKPGDLGQDHPSSWAEVAAQIKGHLLRIAVAPTRFIAEMFEGATRLIRGIGFMSDAVNARIRKAHSAAEDREQARQAMMAGRLPAQVATNADGHQPNAAALVQKLDEILGGLEGVNRSASVVMLDEGVLILLGTNAEARAEIEAEAGRLLSGTAAQRSVSASTYTGARLPQLGAHGSGTVPAADESHLQKDSGPPQPD